MGQDDIEFFLSSKFEYIAAAGNKPDSLSVSVGLHKRQRCGADIDSGEIFFDAECLAGVVNQAYQGFIGGTGDEYPW